ncbi:MAG TPA: flagellar assembly peptidoglycan hydrolase FlgJ [Pseudomonas sp.]|jgi:flagellar protein FlgJ|uniref:flagellar assembly peptidoglycan hydrolase FlgJ n=1 Tax=Stutzerimonas xanthomarina TaxID=271420 RepID=UPI000E9284E3|nr:flagellar assembly peptidoglycan hydrolase FlgJ [Stutzerimonas xanthomarina]MBU0813064.1 flagellar assembly peptidoglycan hydrolase FlgJ [Gammaproteobacteria bacterium]HAQ86744.1 flagellar assembly peptidoglycan hydrolase FlgJ [Pseudomonas sp.]MBK3848499.1 flagellar assembly peptidoglycan hydrolase FlgJ [Stutzerimonas xanthomarina]MBU0851825.1 flagellar assembly peptidoglycan hydrolase FlgJ [Gammaproteobacteria bacterium]MBU1302357.1 flagellar assembly peptidoglycan hydrolase FlgJ [Gammapro|tara:strand:+ start:153 stop:1346 length:1194 start_codon:yes stop_codon:yes gene_type:complete
MENRLGLGRRTPDSGSYSDLNRLNQLKVGKDRDGAENVRKVAQEFESLFMNEMLKSMRSATEVMSKDNPFNSQASKQYQDMHDQQLSVTLSKEGGGIGLADVLIRQLSKQQEPSEKPNPFAQVAQTEGAKWSSNPNSKIAPVDPARNDSQLLNQRRLALPGRFAERAHAEVTAANTQAAQASQAGTAQPLVDVDWKPATAFAAPQDAPLTVNGVEATAPSAPSKTRFSSPAEFIATMLPMAEKAAKRLGVEPRFLVAQAALETGWGKSIIKQKDGTNSHNLFGIKATGWDGASAKVTTTEYVNGKATKEVAGFRAYDSFEHSFNDYVRLLENNDRYKPALQVASASGNSERFVNELQRAGYATDPQYARKINQIARKVQTYQTIADASTSPAVRTRG